MYGFIVNAETYEQVKNQFPQIEKSKTSQLSLSQLESSLWGLKVVCHPNQKEDFIECQTAEDMYRILKRLDSTQEDTIVTKIR